MKTAIVRGVANVVTKIDEGLKVQVLEVLVKSLLTKGQKWKQLYLNLPR